MDDKVRRELQQLTSSTGLNVYQTAKLGSRLQLRLTEAGYPEAFSKAFSSKSSSCLRRRPTGKP